MTWLAVIVMALLTMPGFIIGRFGAMVYMFFIGGMLSDNLFNWVSGGWFERAAFSVMPSAIQGAIGGAFAIWACSKILKSANYEAASYAVSAICIVFTVIGVLGVLSQQGMSLDAIEMVSSTGAMVAVIFAMLPDVKRTQERTTVSSVKVEPSFR
ncbi:hypothetical protein [Azospirillum doebereinerae]|uniref:Uncharacterized protein n=1 Tax=Azospirillum doebereinerae TaxID=92933 RepID=A0A3S0WY85_9PROT|nr:hypothetical protein [Azospirillum doebereinerae]RUQ75782.1 hypothetical protein EJ913_01330 [Azospirillum doebereinerae]